MNTRQLLKDERREEKEGSIERHTQRRERFIHFMAEKYFDGDIEAVGELPRIPSPASASPTDSLWRYFAVTDT